MKKLLLSLILSLFTISAMAQVTASDLAPVPVHSDSSASTISNTSNTNSQANTSLSSQAQARSGAYAGIDVGYAKLDTPSSAPVEGIGFWGAAAQVKLNSFGGGAYVGYHFAVSNNALIGAQLGYNYDGKSRYENFTITPWTINYYQYSIKENDINLMATSKFFIAKRWNFMLDAGLARVTQTQGFDGGEVVGIIAPTLVDQIKPGTIHKTAPVAAFGIGYEFPFHLNVYVKARRLFGSSLDDYKNDKVASATLFAGGVSYSF